MLRELLLSGEWPTPLRFAKNYYIYLPEGRARALG
jgi:hypothetical protein